MGGQMIIETPRVDKMASLPFRLGLRTIKPLEIRFNVFGGLGAVPPDKENIVGGNNCGFATRS